LALIPQALVHGLQLGCVYMLVALGLCLILGVMKTVNFAHGEFLMLGAYAAYYFFTGITWHNYFISFILTMAALFAFGFVIEKALLRPVRGNMLAGFILTLGLSILLSNLGFLVFGTKSKGISNVFPGLITFFNINTSVQEVVIAVIALALMGVVVYIVYRSKLGRAFRAVTQDAEAAQLQGVNIGHISSMGFAIAAALAGAAGALFVILYNAYPTMGTTPVSLAFAIVVLGGLESIPGTIVGALIVGLVESFVSLYLGGVYAWGIIFLMAFLVITFRPQGLFGRA
jgi:branched-chain amino acid transport system permease protein